MIQRLHHQDAELRMPYKKDPLSDEDIDKLTKWIDQGAQWGTHWAYIPGKYYRTGQLQFRFVILFFKNFNRSFYTRRNEEGELETK